MRPVFWTCLLGLFFAGGCSLWQKPPPLPVAHSVALDQLVVNSDFRLSPKNRLLVELDELRDHVAGTLDLPTSDQEFSSDAITLGLQFEF